MLSHRTAAQAALSRIEHQKQRDTTHFNTSLAAIRAQVKREAEAERQLAKTKADVEKLSIHGDESAPKALTDESNLHLAAQGVYFR